VKLHLWLTDEPLSPDADQVIYVDVELRTDLPLPAVRRLLLELAERARVGIDTAEQDRLLLDDATSKGGGS
jgi:hypothetical protein